MRNGVLAGALAVTMLGAHAGRELAAQQTIPDAPQPQPTLPNLNSVTPGRGTTSTSGSDTTAAPPPAATAPAATGPAPSAAASQGESGVIEPTQAQYGNALATLHVHVNFVEVPFTVKDGKGHLLPGLEPQDVQVYENGVMQHITFFSPGDPVPLSVALVIDQSMTQDEMDRVNTALGALQGAFAPYDEIAVFTYNKSTRMVTDYTGAQSARLTQAIERSKGSGREPMLAGSLGGPLAQTTVVNDWNVDPNTSANRGHTSPYVVEPRDIHPLNDAILAAATSLHGKPIGRRRVIYVISDGKDYGSEAKTAQVKKYLLANNIEVDGTLVGDSSLPVVGTLDHLHLPGTLRENVLIGYKDATGGQLDSEFRIGSIEKSFARIATEVRTRYVVGYYTSETVLDEKYRTLEVRVIGHGGDLTILAKKGYWPAAVEQQMRPIDVPISAP